jgi:glycosyltransferase involved in cell wall biosynthesis
MRIVIDMQGAQAAQRFELAGRSTLSLAQAIVRQRGSHEVMLALNGLFPDSIEPIRAAFDGLLPQSNIRVWYTAGPLAARDPGNDGRRALAATVREAFLASMGADVVLVSSWFEGYADDAVTSAGAFAAHPPAAVLVHDLRPLREPGMLPAPGQAAHYRAKAGELGDALLLALAPEAARDARALLDKKAVDLSGTPAPGWDQMARRAIDALETLHVTRPPADVAAPADALLGQVIARIPQVLGADEQDTELRKWAHFLSRFPQGGTTRQLFVDVSELVRHDARTGVQRVTRSILKELLGSPPPGFQVAPVYVTGGAAGYRYAHAFTAQFLGVPAAGADEPIDYQPEDVFLGLDLLPHLVPQHKPFLQALHRDGVRVFFVVYDLLPVLMPEHFPPGTAQGHTAWLHAISSFDGAVCISRAVALELAQWQRRHAAPRLRPFDIGWFHLGADVQNSVPTRGLPDDAARVLARLAERPTLLAVGTIEPRKHYGQLLGACELLWAQGREVNLVMVGKQGWMVNELAERLRGHAELGKRLFWLEGVSDEYLERVYAAADALVAASVGEGFGLPLIEAAQNKLPIIARDLPVFREVGGEHAFYFSGTEPQELAAALETWLAQRAGSGAPSPAGLSWLTWADSARQLMAVVLGEGGRAAQLLAPLPLPPRTRPRVLTLAPYPVRRPRHGGQLRAAAMLRVYEAAGFDVHPVGFYQAEAYEADDIGPNDIAFPHDSPFRNYLGVPLPALSDFLMGPFAVASDSVFRQVAAGLPGPVDVIQVEQPWLYGLARWLQAELPACRGAVLVNSSHNIEAPMKRGILAQHCTPQLIEHAVADMASIERELAHDAELSLAVTVEDAEVLRTYGAPRVLHAPNGISPWQADPERCAQWSARLPQQPWPIFIASAHPPNFTGFIDAIGDSLACIPAGSKLVIAGGVGPHLERALGNSRWAELNLSRLQVLGVLDDADLAAVKSLAHAFLLPIGAGGGSNIKTAEALYSGRPVICTRTALRGFEHFADLPEVTVADTPDQFQAAIRAVLEQGPIPLAGGEMRASLTWDACLAAVPREVAAILEQRKAPT